MYLTRIFSLIAVGLLCSCAASVQHSSSELTPLSIPAESGKRVVMIVVGSDTSTQSADWEAFKGEWRGAMASAAAANGMTYLSREEAPPARSETGTLVTIDVHDYRYLTPGARFGFGIMTGNAYIDATVRFADLTTGAEYGERTYNTSSSAWQGVFSAVTDKQVRAICDEIILEIRSHRPGATQA